MPLLVVCSARPELLTRRPGWGGGKANALTLSLSPLSGEETARLIGGLLEQAVLPAPMQQALLARAEGNPLFAEEYIRMLRDQGSLRREGDVWRLDDVSVEVPATVQGIIAARLDALAAAEKEVVQDASVLGKVFWLGAVVSVGERSRWETEEILHSLERKELVRRERRASVAGEVEYAFRHVLVRDVAYRQIPRARRADLHLAAAAWIDSLAAERSEDRAEMLAHHYVAALELVRAAGRETSAVETPARLALREAGRRAYALSALDAAARSYRAALELWPEGDGDRPRLLLELGRALYQAGGLGGAELREAASQLSSLGDVEGASEAESLLGDVAWMAGNQVEARVHYDRSVELVDGLPTSRTTMWVRGARFRFLALAGDRPSLEDGERVLAEARSLGTTEDYLNAWINLGLARNREGDLRGLDDLAGALDQALAANSHVAARAYVNLASMANTLGDLPRGRELHREGLAVAQRFGSGLERWLVSECVLDDYHAGDWDLAVPAARELADRSTVERQYMDVGPLSVLAGVALARGDDEAARTYAERMLAGAREIGDPQALWPCLGVHARVALECGERLEAATRVDELVRRLRDAQSLEADVALFDGFVAAEALGRAAELAASLERAVVRTPWAVAFELIGSGDLEAAAAVLREQRAFSQAAYLELVAAERSGRETPGLAYAIPFFRRVAATAYLARTESLLQASA